MVFFAAGLALVAYADTQVFSGYVYSGSSISIDKQVVFIYLGTDGIVADYGTGFFSISNNTCESSDYFKICLDNIDYDYSAKKKRIYLRTFSTVPFLEITRSVTKSDLVVGEEAAFTVSISNSGGIARNATYTDFFPDSFSVYDVRGAELIGNSVVWSGSIARLGSRDIQYKIKPKNAFKQSLKASLTYFDGYMEQTIYSSEQTISSTNFVGLETALGKSSVFIGQPNNFTLNVTNRGNDTVNMSVLVTFSSDVSVFPPSSFSRIANNTFKWSGDLKKRNLSNNRYTSKFFMFKIESSRVSASEVIVDSSYYNLASGDFVSLSKDKKTIKVSESGVVVRSNLNDRVLEPNEAFTMKIWLQNLNAYVPIRDVYVSTYTDMGYSPDTFIHELPSSRQEVVLEKEYFAPNVSGTSGFSLYVNVSYNVSDTKSFKTYKDTLSVTPIKDLVINQLATKTTVESGKTFSVTVSVSNPRITGINNVRIYDTIPSEFSKFGLSSGIVSIPKKDAITAYTYELTAPRVSEEKTFTIRTNAEYADSDNEYAYLLSSDYNFSKEISIVVQPVKFQLDVAQTMADTELFTGHIHDISYVIKNPSDDKVATGVMLHLPLQQEFDVVASTNFSLPDIDPGESVFLSSKHRIRPKLNDSQTLQKAYFTFKDKYGLNYTFNASESILKIKSSPIYGPALILSRNSSDTVNNTEKFNVTLSIKNIGETNAIARITDGNDVFEVVVPAGIEYIRNRTLSFSEEGTYAIQSAVAEYPYNGMKLYTASNSKVVSVVNKPMLKIEKTAPAKANNLDTVPVIIKLKVLQSPLAIRVVDGADEWQFDELSGEKEIIKNVSFDSQGVKTLGKATAFYILDNRTYNVSSNDISLSVSERSLASLTKTVSRSGKDLIVWLILKNEREGDLSVEVNDDGKTWSVKLGAGKEENLTYKIKPKGKILPRANGTFFYNGNKQVIYSSSIELGDLMNETMAEEQSVEEEPNFFKKIINGLLKILTFKKSDI